MDLPKILRKEYRAPVILSAVLTFVVWNAFSFGWLGLPNLGFRTAGGAEQFANAKMEKVAVPLAAQLCAIKFNAQLPLVVADKTAKLAKATYTYAKSEQLDKAWVMLGDGQSENQRVIDACTDLIIAAPTQKAADLQHQ